VNEVSHSGNYICGHTCACEWRGPRKAVGKHFECNKPADKPCPGPVVEAVKKNAAEK
jgi:hypothetical protein